MENYEAQLEAAKFPPYDVFMLDFENYFDADYTLMKMSTIEYIVDPRFKFTGVGWATAPNFQACFSHSVEAAIHNLQVRYGDNFERATVLVANARYDITVLQEKFGIVPPYVVDIQDLARHYDSRMSHSVADLAKLFKAGEKGDTNQFKGLHPVDMTFEQWAALEEYCKLDVKIQCKLFKLLMEKLTWPEMELPIARHTLGLYLDPRFNFDFTLAEDTLGKMEELLQEIIEPTGFDKKLLGSKIVFPEQLQLALDDYGKGEKVPMKMGKNEMIPALAKDDVGFQELQAHPYNVVSEMCAARVAVKSWPTHIKRIKSMTAQAMASFGQLRVPLAYYGCHTGRPSGGEKINLLNLGGKGRKGMGTHKLIAFVRKMLICPEGYSLVISDSAQIEARLLSWLVEQDDLTAGFARNEDIYSEFATGLFSMPVRKPKPDDTDDLRHDMDMMRGFGKDAILGCGYGMGAKRFYENCLANPDLRPLFDDGTYTYVFIERLIKTYRKKYSKIPEMWEKLNGMFKYVIKFPGEIAYYSHGVQGVFTPVDKPLLKVWCDNGTLHVKLPSGRVLYYRHSSVGIDGNVRWHHGHLWGGSIIENIIQSIARDLLMIWIVECEKEEIPVVMHCYDEIVGMVPDDEAEECLDIMDQIMCEAPDWAAGMPLACEGKISKFYTK